MSDKKNGKKKNFKLSTASIQGVEKMKPVKSEKKNTKKTSNTKK